MNYTLHQLRIFAKVSELQSITKASEELFLTQPAVSIQLKKLQDQFPIPLTEVIGRKLYITDFGKEIASFAEAILDQVKDIDYKTMTYQGDLAGQLKVSSVSTGKYVTPYFLSDFIRNNRLVELVMDVTNKGHVVNHLEKNEVDFAMVSVIPDHLKTSKVELMPNKLFLVGGTILDNGELVEPERIFEEFPLIFREPGSATRNAMETFLKKKNLPVSNRIELTSNEALKQAVIAGLGYSIMPLIGIKNELRNGDLRIIPYKGLPISTTWNLIWLSAKNLSPVAMAFLEYVKKEKERIMQEYFSWYENY